MPSLELLETLMELGQDLQYRLCLNGDTFPIIRVSITNSPTPVNEPTIRGGVYFAEKTAYRMVGTVEDLSIVPLLTKKMLGPNTEFAKLRITTRVTHDDDQLNIEILTNLTDSVQGPDSVELGMTIVDLASKKVQIESKGS